MANSSEKDCSPVSIKIEKTIKGIISKNVDWEILARNRKQRLLKIKVKYENLNINWSFKIITSYKVQNDTKFNLKNFIKGLTYIYIKSGKIGLDNIFSDVILS